jgi:hypothetical protein
MTTNQQTVNRWTTPVNIHVTLCDRTLYIKWFRDFQEGYLYAERFVNDCISRNEENWFIHEFVHAADQLKQHWVETKSGLVLATQSSTQTAILIYYEPDEEANIQSILSMQRRLERHV